MPVESEHAPERLEPPRVGEAPEHLRRSILVDDGHRDGAGEFPHSCEEISRRGAGVERKLGELTPHLCVNSICAGGSAFTWTSRSTHRPSPAPAGLVGTPRTAPP